MKIKKGYIIKEVADSYIVVPVNDMVNENNIIISFNQTGAFIWELLQNDISYEDALAKIIDHYDVDYDTAKRDFDMFIKKSRDIDILE